MKMRFLLWLLKECPGDKMIRVKSWIPSWGRHGLEWPTMLIETRAGRRMTATPIWDRQFLRGLFPLVYR